MAAWSLDRVTIHKSSQKTHNDVAQQVDVICKERAQIIYLSTHRLEQDEEATESSRGSIAGMH
jgi:hypothetical protein